MHCSSVSERIHFGALAPEAIKDSGRSTAERIGDSYVVMRGVVDKRRAVREGIDCGPELRSRIIHHRATATQRINRGDRNRSRGGRLVPLQVLILGYKRLSFWRASSILNCQSTPRCLAFVLSDQMPISD